MPFFNFDSDEAARVEVLNREREPGEFTDADKAAIVRKTLNEIAALDELKVAGLLFVALPHNAGEDVEVFWTGTGEHREQCVLQAMQSLVNVNNRDDQLIKEQYND